jgi:hypothetical protein
VDLSAAKWLDFTRVIHSHLDLKPPLACQATQPGRGRVAPQRSLSILQNRFSASKNPQN